MRKLFEILYLGFLASALICFSFSAVFLMGAKAETTSFKEYEIASALISDVSDVTKVMVSAVAWVVFKSLGGKKERKEDVTERK